MVFLTCKLGRIQITCLIRKIIHLFSYASTNFIYLFIYFTSLRVLYALSWLTGDFHLYHKITDFFSMFLVRNGMIWFSQYIIWIELIITWRMNKFHLNLDIFILITYTFIVCSFFDSNNCKMLDLMSFHYH